MRRAGASLPWMHRLVRRCALRMNAAPRTRCILKRAINGRRNAACAAMRPGRLGTAAKATSLVKRSWAPTFGKRTSRTRRISTGPMGSLSSASTARARRKRAILTRTPRRNSGRRATSPQTLGSRLMAIGSTLRLRRSRTLRSQCKSRGAGSGNLNSRRIPAA